MRLQKDRKNEIFIDLLERLTVLFGANGLPTRAEIDGCIQMKSFLAGQPELRVGLNEDLHIGQAAGGGTAGSCVKVVCRVAPSISLHNLFILQTAAVSCWPTATFTSVEF